MSKTRLIRRLLVVLSLALLVVQIARTSVWPFNYYHDYNLLKRAVLDSGCVITHQIVNEDLTLEEIRFRLRTQSGWNLEIFFPQDRDARQLCDHPKGILFCNPEGYPQVCTVEYLCEALKSKNLMLTSLGDILRNIDEIVPVLRANYENKDFPRTSTVDEKLDEYVFVYWGPWKPSTSPPTQVSEPRSVATSQLSEPGPNGLPLRTAAFDVLTLNSSGAVRDRQNGRARYYVEELGGAATLEMVQIPGGTFLMGTSSAEATLVQATWKRYSGEDFADFWQEGPAHTVSVPGFYMGKFEVTQAQWRAVSELPQVDRALPSNPSRHKGDDRPVENVSWLDAVEFCDRLTQATGRLYRLPTEAEWEYAVRAGTTTQFHFGDAITTELVNYDGIYPYGSVSWGIDRDETTPVGSLGAPNAFGLYDMHGNAAELCLDPWHDNYNGAPADGSAWTTNADDYVHVVRGGTFFQNAASIRAASRGKSYNPTRGCYDGGFRVVAVAPTRWDPDTLKQLKANAQRKGQP